MCPQQNNFLFCRIFSITTFFGAVVMLLLLSACSGNRKSLGDAITERDSLPIMDTRGVTTLISDSGVTRYRITTEEWLVFDKKNPSYWAFEKGLFLEKFDSLFDVEASVKSDTAYYYDKKKLWKLIGNVDIRNVKGERFETELLYWDQDKHTIYSDKFIRIEQPDRIVTGHGFDSNEQMTIYKIRQAGGNFYVDDDASTSPTDSLHTDSLNTNSVQADTRQSITRQADNVRTDSINP